MAQDSARFLNMDGLSIRYWKNAGGDKPAIVFFHGWAFSLDNWLQIGTLEGLAKGGYAVYAVDLPAGRGSKSSKIKYEKAADLVPTIEKILSGLGLGSRSVVLVGPSMGGGFALAYALAHPERISALVLISPALHLVQDEDLSGLEVPVLLVWGENDSVFPLDEVGRPLKNELLHSKLIILKGAGHAAYLDKPSEFNELLLEFLEEAL